ncbi:MAG TPA: hypothetical protein VIH99_02085 [Bdellovibrionota bacterium]|jgi:hypothetical protein
MRKLLPVLVLFIAGCAAHGVRVPASNQSSMFTSGPEQRTWCGEYKEESSKETQRYLQLRTDEKSPAVRIHLAKKSNGTFTTWPQGESCVCMDGVYNSQRDDLVMNVSGWTDAMAQICEKQKLGSGRMPSSVDSSHDGTYTVRCEFEDGPWMQFKASIQGEKVELQRLPSGKFFESSKNSPVEEWISVLNQKPSADKRYDNTIKVRAKSGKIDLRMYVSLNDAGTTSGFGGIYDEATRRGSDVDGVEMDCEWKK